MNGKACAGTGEQVHLNYIHMRAKCARRDKDRGEKKMAGRKRLPENRDSKKDSGEIYHKQRRGIVGKGDLL